MITIQNDLIQAGIQEKGAEFARLRSIRTGLDYLWEADPTYWGRHSCILFPVIGATRNDIIRVNGQKYPMQKHGIVRDREFELIEQSVDRVTYATRSDNETIKSYPFDFELLVTYSLDENTLHIDYEVTTDGEEHLPFSIGGHPAFNCPLYGDQKRSDYKLVFSDPEDQHSPLLSEAGLLREKTKMILDNATTLTIEDELFDEDALILSDLKSDSVSFVGPNGRPSLTVSFGGFTHLGIWSKSRESPFVCIEPWYGHADPENFDGEFRDKPGVVLLAPDEVFTCRHSVTVESA
ncbi:MAG: aldose 1-epimerase family protein [Bacteroidota bacterium]